MSDPRRFRYRVEVVSEEKTPVSAVWPGDQPGRGAALSYAKDQARYARFVKVWRQRPGQSEELVCLWQDGKRQRPPVVEPGHAA